MERGHRNLFHMDEYFWEPGNLGVKRPSGRAEADISSVAALDQWVIEGVFGELASLAAPQATLLVWLDLDWGNCEQGLWERALEESLETGPGSAFENLVAWAKD